VTDHPAAFVPAGYGGRIKVIFPVPAAHGRRRRVTARSGAGANSGEPGTAPPPPWPRVPGLRRPERPRAAGVRRWSALVAAITVTGALAACPAPGRSPHAPGEPAASGSVVPTAAYPAGRPPAVRVAGNQFVGADGRPIRLRGFNHAGAEYACIDGTGFFDTADGRAPSSGVVRQMAGWRGATAVRVPLNEQCWLGLPAATNAYAGAAYRAAVGTFVDRLNAAGLIAILDLHRSAPGPAVSAKQEQMPDREHSPAFWRSVAATFADRPAVVFDLFNEPFPYAETDSARAWSCWRDGGCTLTSVNSGQPYVAAGMSELVAAVRATGARNVLLAGGLHWAEGMRQWLVYRPADPLGQLAASFHAYSFNTFCADLACYDRDLTPILRAVPLVVGEIGPSLTVGAAGVDDDCPRDAVGGRFAVGTLDWLDAHGAGYTAWSWNPWPDCWALVRDWSGTPTEAWGAEFRRRLAS
jgi:endoglucanase